LTAKDITPNGAAAVSPRLPLSVLIRSLNEADRIAKTIKSALPLNCEIVVIDAGSKDATVEIAKSLGATVYVNPWPGFGPQRRFGEEKCANDMVFSLDADEILTADLVAELRRLLTRPALPRLIIVRKAMIFPNHDRPPPLGFCHEQVLIYDRRIARTNLNPNWDKLDISEPERPVKLRNPLWHFSYRDWNHVMAKWNYVSQLAADTSEPRSRLELVVRLAGEFPISFLRFYFLRRYFLGGADGFTLAMLTAVGRFLRIAKMLERKDHGWKRSATETR
jgi:glycosyltransferase involved in cell wall biosynthesis